MPDSPHLSMHHLPDTDRPRERLLSKGADSLSSAELLAILLRTGSAEENVVHLAQRILAHFDGLHGLAQASAAELSQFKGLGSAKVAQIVAAIELSKRLMTSDLRERPMILRAEDAFRLVSDMCYLQQEHVRVILLDVSRRVVAISTVYIGTINASVMRIAEIYREAITRNSPAVIVVHNHPSGDASPSPEDIDMTRSLIAAANLLDIVLVDHLIVGRQEWRSLKEMGLGFGG